MSESEHKMIEILRILKNQEKPTGSKFIADKLKEKGFNLGERAVRYHMQILDEKGFTERIGYAGRKITDLGLKELEKALIYDQVDFILSKFKEKIYQTDFDINTRKGNVVVNTSTIHDIEALDVIKDVFKNSLCVSPYVDIKKNRNNIEIKTICGTTIDGILLNNGVASFPTYGGLLEIEDYSPTKFTELMSYKKTSVIPLDAFYSEDSTSVMDVISTGCGVIPANFRLIPSASRDKTIALVEKLKKIGFTGIIEISEEGENLFGIPITEGMVGIAICGGMSPLCAAKEMNYPIDIRIGEEFAEFESLKSIEPNSKRILKNNRSQQKGTTAFILNKSLNKIQNVTFDINKEKGKIISNFSYVNKEDLDESLEIMAKTYKDNPDFINKHYQVVKLDDRYAIVTICSLSIDGILINNKIISTPKYGGLLEITNNPQFTDLISYSGSTLDPHKIFISKKMTDICNKKRILASVKEIPLIARDESVEIFEKLKEIGFPIYKIGKAREFTYNANIENYNFGVVTGSGLNQIGALKENNIPVDIKAISKHCLFENMEKF